jgi:hypothetical protein
VRGALIVLADVGFFLSSCGHLTVLAEC